MKRLAIISICLVLLIGGLSFYNNSRGQQTKEIAKTRTLESKKPTIIRSGASRMNESTESRISRFEQALIDEDPPIFSEPAKALDHLSGDLKEGFIYPDRAELQQLDPSAEAVIKNLIGIYIMPVVERDDPNYGTVPPEVHIYFSDGSKNVSPTGFDRRETILMTMHVDENKTDPQQRVERVMRDRRNGESTLDVDSKVIDINGIPGYAELPGYIEFDHDSKTPRAGFVCWQQGNIVYNIYGLPGENGTQIHALAAIARSMKPVKKD